MPISSTSTPSCWATTVDQGVRLGPAPGKKPAVRLSPQQRIRWVTVGWACRVGLAASWVTVTGGMGVVSAVITAVAPETETGSSFVLV